MKTKISPAIVGAFVIGAFALGLVALLAFGGVNIFRKPQRFIVFFDESTHGLDLGSTVQLYGVRVGRVAGMNVRYDEARNHSVVAVVCEFNRDVVTDNTGAAIHVADRAELQTLVDRGLRAQLAVQGLATGLLFVELEFVDPKLNPAEGRTDPKYTVVPYIPSAIAGFQASLTEILANLKKTDFAGLSKGLATLLASTQRQLDGVDLKGVAEQWRKTGAQLEALASSPQIQRTFDNLNAAVTDLRATIAKLDGQVQPTATQLQDTLREAKQTIESFNATALAAKQFIAAHAGLGDDVAGALDHLNEAADAVKRLADFLERNPNALLTGKKRP